MTEIDRRTVLKTVLGGGVIAAAAGVAVTPKVAEAIPFVAAKANPLTNDEIGPVEPEELAEDLVEKAQVVVVGPRRRRRGRHCFWRRGRRVCVWR
jgi:hypothetical protein